MEDFDLHYVARKSVKGVAALVSRTFLIQLLGIVTSLLLTVLLEPEIFGIFFVVSSIVVFLNYFQDIGLAASLIQKKGELTKQDMQTTFTVQQILVLVLVIPSIFFSKQITSFYDLQKDGQILFIALAVSFFLSSLRTIPTVILERNLEFNKLVLPQIVENILYNVTLIICAVFGMGVTSFALAVLVRSVSGLIILYYIQKWPIGISFDYSVFKRLVSFGIPFQTNTLLALLKDDLLTVYLGKVLMFSHVGYIGFAQRYAFLPLRLVMDNVIKITFPSFSRLQHDKEGLRIGIEKSLFLISALIFPSAIGMIMLSGYLIDFIPKYQKWEPALLSLYFFSLNTVFSSISTPLTNFLNAVGKVKITLYFMVFWTMLTWIATIILIKIYGYEGVAIGSFLVSLTSVFVIIISRKYITFSFIKPIGRQFAASLILLLFLYITKDFVVKNIFLLLLEVILGGLIYLSVLYLLAKDEIKSTVGFIIKTVRS